MQENTSGTIELYGMTEAEMRRAAAGFLHHLLAQILPQHDEDQDQRRETQHNIQDQTRRVVRDLLLELILDLEQYDMADHAFSSL